VTTGFAAVVAMYAAFMVVGWVASRKVPDGTAADLIVAGRPLPLWVAALTMTAPLPLRNAVVREPAALHS
jgi:Na+/proline symporter